LEAADEEDEEEDELVEPAPHLGTQFLQLNLVELNFERLQREEKKEKKKKKVTF